MENTRTLERRLGDTMRRKLPDAVAEFIMFVLKQGWACLYGGLLLIAIILTQVYWSSEIPIARYDALLMIAIALQILFFVTGLETWEEVRVIALFHITGTVMEIFKVAAGSWEYPGDGVFKLFDVPLFSGFMYASVGSYMARVIRIFEMRFAPYPPFWASVALAVAIYANFFTHHFGPDMRYVLFAITVLVFIRTRIWFLIGTRWYWMPLPVAAFLSSFFMWLAENIGTMANVWVYAGQGDFEVVSLAKMGSWYLLLFVSFVTVTLVLRSALCQEAWHPKSTRATATHPKAARTRPAGSRPETPRD